jgi:hypothetical protein
MDEIREAQRRAIILFEEIAELGVAVELQLVHTQVSQNHIRRTSVLYATCEGQNLLDVVRVVTPHRNCRIEGVDRGLKITVDAD